MPLDSIHNLSGRPNIDQEILFFCSAQKHLIQNEEANLFNCMRSNYWGHIQRDMIKFGILKLTLPPTYSDVITPPYSWWLLINQARSQTYTVWLYNINLFINIITNCSPMCVYCAVVVHTTDKCLSTIFNTYIQERYISNIFRITSSKSFMFV